MEYVKVLDTHKLYGETWESLCIIAGERHGLPNDSHLSWTVGEDQEDQPSGGYLTREQELAIDKWCLDEGAEMGETILIWISW